jgi:deoxyribonuclease-4
MVLGSHLSVAGGLHKAVEKAAELGFDAVALFVRNQVQWRVPPLPEQAVATFKETRRRLGIRPVVAHASYLFNLACNHTIRAKSIDAMVADLQRCNRLGVEFLVLHPGSCPNLEDGIARIADGLNEIMQRSGRGRAKVLLETTAGQGNCIGHRFEHLAEILQRVKRRGRFGVCLDTCHVFAAGYDLRTPATYAETLQEFDDVVGLERLCAVHLNDSKRELGSRVDRHEHIGRGKLGRKAFANLVNDERLAAVPLILETPKGRGPRGREWDTVNKAALNRLRKR